jgi:hypothetical protein
MILPRLYNMLTPLTTAEAGLFTSTLSNETKVVTTVTPFPADVALMALSQHCLKGCLRVYGSLGNCPLPSDDGLFGAAPHYCSMRASHEASELSSDSCHIAIHLIPREAVRGKMTLCPNFSLCFNCGLFAVVEMTVATHREVALTIYEARMGS